MSVEVYKATAAEVWDLLFTEYLSMLSVMEQESMHRALSNSSRLWIGMADDKALVTYGLIPPTLMSDTAYLWMFNTKYLTEHLFVLIRHSQRAVQQMLEDYPLIVGHGRVNDRRSLRWLRWLGAEFGEPTGPFIPFQIKAKQWQQDSAQSA